MQSTARHAAGSASRAHVGATTMKTPKQVKPQPKQKGTQAVVLRKSKNQLAFRYREIDTPMSVTRTTAKAVAQALGVDETQMVHLAIRKLAQEMLPQYPEDNGPLTAAQIAEIKALVPQDRKRKASASLFGEAETA